MVGECLDPTLLVQSSSRGSVHELILSAYIVLCGRADYSNNNTQTSVNSHHTDVWLEAAPVEPWILCAENLATIQKQK